MNQSPVAVQTMVETASSDSSSSSEEMEVSVVKTVVLVQQHHHQQQHKPAERDSNEEDEGEEDEDDDDDDDDDDYTDASTTIIATTTTTKLTHLELIKNRTDKFDPEILYNAFMLSVLEQNEGEEEDVSLRCYLIAYEEITKFLYNLGNIFYFVIADLRKKITLIETYLERQPDEYATVRRMVKYEWAEGMLSKPVSLNKQNASRVILRLHRALIFIIRLLERVFYADGHLRTAQLCTEAYESTLAKYHRYKA